MKCRHAGAPVLTLTLSRGGGQVSGLDKFRQMQVESMLCALGLQKGSLQLEFKKQNTMKRKNGFSLYWSIKIGIQKYVHRF